MKREIALVGILVLALSPTAASDNNLEGDRTIDCSIYAIQYIDCSPDPCCAASNDFNVTVGQMESVTLTITWTAQSEHSTRFKGRIIGNFACAEETGNSSCDNAHGEGVSPMVMTLYGTAASNDTIFAGVSLDDNCDHLLGPSESVEDAIFGNIESCQESPFVQAAFNQSYHYEWTLVSS